MDWGYGRPRRCCCTSKDLSLPSGCRVCHRATRLYKEEVHSGDACPIWGHCAETIMFSPNCKLKVFQNHGYREKLHLKSQQLCDSLRIETLFFFRRKDKRETVVFCTS